MALSSALGKCAPTSCLCAVLVLGCSSDGKTTPGNGPHDDASIANGSGGTAPGSGGVNGNAGASGAAASTGGRSVGAGGGSAGVAGSAGSSGSAGGNASDGGPPVGGKRPFPDTTSTISILTDQLPNLTPAQRQFVVKHFVGTEKQTLSQSEPLRALAPNFLVLHYHLSMWQSAPATSFIIDGTTWGNDYPTVTTHENWFWHNTSNQRLASTADQKLLMNVTDPAFQSYWASSLVSQVEAGDYDGVFFDSASPALLQAEVGGQDSRLAGTGAKDSVIPEIGNQNFISAWQSWMSALDATLAAKGIPLIPNTSAFVTSWDNTNYGLTAGAFVEGFADTSWAVSDWKASTNRLLSLAAKHKILILQNYLGSPTDVGKRLFYLGNYLLVKGDRTYLEYFANGPFEWYPEWQVTLGAPKTTGVSVDDLAAGGVYRRDFEKGAVLVNPTDAAVDVTLSAAMQRVTPVGGGAVDAQGNEPGTVSTSSITTLSVAAHGAEILLE